VDELTEEESAVVALVREWVDREVRPAVRELEHDNVYPAKFIDQMKELGIFGLAIPEPWGEAQVSAQCYAAVTEELARGWMSLAGAMGGHTVVAKLLLAFGTPDQRDAWLPKMATGEVRAAMALTEPGGGSDLQAMRTTARRDGAEYVVNGAKTWITNSYYGSCFALLVKTDPAAEPRHKGMSLLIAEKGDGFNVTRKLPKLGYRGIDTCEIFFENYRVPADRLIGGIEGRGLKHILNGLELGRINVAARGVGVADAALRESVAYAQTRKTFGKPICEHQAIQLKLAEMATRVEAARLLTYRAAEAFDRRERCDMEAGMAKYFATEAALENATEAMRIHGAYGYSKEFNIERLYRDAPLLAIGEGTNELQRIIIARQLVARNPI
jgi:alkylation response protein AidB-like acyl-CoA dehydrogenase